VACPPALVNNVSNAEFLFFRNSRISVENKLLPINILNEIKSLNYKCTHKIILIPFCTNRLSFTRTNWGREQHCLGIHDV